MTDQEPDAIAAVKARIFAKKKYRSSEEPSVTEESVSEDIGTAMLGATPRMSIPAVATKAKLCPAEARDISEDGYFDFAEDFQAKIAALVLRDENFVRRNDGIIHPHHFENHAEAILVGLSQRHYDEYGILPEGSVWVEILKEANATRIIRDKDIYRDVVVKLKELRKANISNADFVLDKVANFAKRQEIMKALYRSIDLAQKGEFDAIEKNFSKAFDIGVTRNYEEIDYWGTIEERTQRRKDKASGLIKSQGIPTGVKKIDQLLYHKGLGRKELSVIMGGAKKGKCVTRDTILLTEDGMLDIGDYVPTNSPVDKFVPHKMKLLGRDGMEYTSDIYNNGQSETIKIVTDRGYEIEGTHNHPMLVASESGHHIWKNLEDVTYGDMMVVQSGWNVFGSTTCIAYASKNKRFPRKLTTELAEWMGIIAGAHLVEDSLHLKFLKKNYQTAERYTYLTELLFNIAPSLKVHDDFYISNLESEEVGAFLTNIGMQWTDSSEKTIPVCIKKSPKHIFVSFLQALIGTEFLFDANVKVDVTMASKRMIQEAHVALTNFGIVATRFKTGNRWGLKTSGEARGRRDYAYDKVIAIRHSVAQTVDFTVPDTHSFFANGLISHNSMGLGELAARFSLQGYNVFYATLEVSLDIIADRLDANISKTRMDELEDSVHAVEATIKDKASIAGEFKILEFPSGQLSCRELKRTIESYRSRGIKFDIIVVDYADIMSPDVYTQNEIENSKQIWLGLRAIAQKENAAMLTATQTNRTGFKNTTAKAEDVSEDFNKIRIADLVMSINRTDEERDKGEARLYFAASRNQAGEFSITIKQDLARMSFIDGVIGIS